MTCDIVKANFPLVESRWVTAHLPVQFRIESDRFPTNRIDDIDSVTSVEEGSGGFALFNLAGTYEIYEIGEYVQISDATIGGYNGVWRIVDTTYSDMLLLEVGFLGTATAALQRYYRNYAVKVDVWAGIPSGHPLNSRRPIEKKTSSPLLYRPRTDNIAYIDISDFVRADLPNIDNRLCENVVTPSDVNTPSTDLWTSFYIGYSEVWDIVDSEGNAIQTNTTTTLVGAQLLLNNEFVEGTSGTTAEPILQWTNEDNPDTVNPPFQDTVRVFNFSPAVFEYVAQIQRVSSDWIGNKSRYLTQVVPTEAGKTYQLGYRAFKGALFTDGTTDVLRFYDLTNGLSVSDRVEIGNVQMPQFQTYEGVIRFTATQNNMKLGFSFDVNDPLSTNLQVLGLTLNEITEIVIDPNDQNPAETVTTEIFYATQSTQQFQYPFGNSMAEYSVPNNGGVFFGKFLTLFEEPVLFEGYPLDLAIILPDNEPYPADVLHWVALDRNRTPITSGDIDFTYYGEGVYRFAISDVPYPDTAFYVTVQLESVLGILSETKTIRIDRSVCRNGVFLTWLNYLGGWDSWLFTGYQDFNIDFQNVQETKRNIFNIWDNRFVNGNTQTDYVQVQSRQGGIARSQYLSEAEIDAIKWIKQSIKVQELSKTRNCTEATRRTVSVDKSGFTWKKTGRRLREFEVSYKYTNDVQTQTQ